MYVNTISRHLWAEELKLGQLDKLFISRGRHVATRISSHTDVSAFLGNHVYKENH